MGSQHTEIKRRRILQISGLSTAGIIGFSRRTLAEEEDANVTIEVPDQVSDGESLIIESFETDIGGQFQIFQDTDERPVYKMMEIEAGTEFTNRELELDDPIPESQSVRTSLYPIDGGRSYDTTSSEVFISETVNDTEPVETPYGTEPGVQKIEADPDAGFQSPYFLYTPDLPSVEESVNDSQKRPLFQASVNDSQERPLVVTAHPWGEFEERVEGASGPDGGITGHIADAMNCPVLSVPLTLTRGHLGLEPQELTLAPELEIDDPRRERVDLQLIAMIEDAKSRLNNGAYTIADGIHYDGGSSAAYFIEKVAPLHPEYINAYSFGANGHAFLPFEELTDDIPVHGDPDRTTIPWPIGAGNLEELTGEEFNKEAWMDIEQFRWIGGEDQDPDDPENYVHKRFRGDDEIDRVVDEIFGTLQVDDRFETSREIYDHLDVPATFRKFEGQPHSPDLEYRMEAAEFHKEQIEEDFELVHLTPQELTSEAHVGDTVAVSVTATNLTDVESSTTISFAVDRPEDETAEVDTKEVQIDPKSTETIELETAFEETGEFTLRVNETSVGDPVVVTEEPVEEDDESTETEDDHDDDHDDDENGGADADEQPGFGVVQTLTAVGGIGYLIKQRLSTDD